MDTFKSIIDFFLVHVLIHLIAPKILFFLFVVLLFPFILVKFDITAEEGSFRNKLFKASRTAARVTTIVLSLALIGLIAFIIIRSLV
ncbi:hypothetical protein J2Z66_001563 [Paenibacillus eucommiae]|uniref:Uncharacterized protein n=1 Tax=Paenibacillus eucommiae TaxID=1355755 RepID=A0ABS4IS61_9BACL|nr:hypothetical protein [Paenibacillus eucommiae]